MTSKAKKEDGVQSAVRAGKEAIAKHEKPLPAGLEAAWAEWSKSIQKVDARAMTLLRAAFEAGWEAGKRTKL